MEYIGTVVIYIIMVCAVLGAFAYLRNEEEGLGKEFVEGLYSIGPIFVPVAGIMAAIPYLSAFVKTFFGPLFSAMGADPAIAATTFIAVDMGGYQLAETLAQSKEGWIMAMVVGYMAGATIVFSVPVGLTMLQKKDHKYMALGIMSGLLSIPIGVFATCSILSISDLAVRGLISANAESAYTLALTFSAIFTNLIPLTIFCVALAIGLKMVPNAMIKGFLWFGRGMHISIILVLVFSVVEYFTGAFTSIFGSWGFDPIIADEKDQFRALEIAGYIGIMLCGAFPMVYLIKKYLATPMESVGKIMGLKSEGAAGMLAAAANILAMFRLIQDMRAKDKVLCIAFAVCAAFMFGDHLAFTANFQPNMILPVLSGKLIGGLSGFGLAYLLSVPTALILEKQEEIKESI
ncbi:MAG: ethanolamine utilization protein EutH [Desulfobulbaceae bacterium S3730MH12]|nr:MAG: ethanolamine utilization protein EutH [Desulfobulbaceae bacterium S5133MH15]OEU56025.1 MAG: ethanolamine utilization protein EutH [Desulfobulbaceae bacterium S3730MH12]OEU82627.1 MAG: ethanolamine utilization protein EutH [Desulfobulbaceae bacterium C00003063]